MILQRITHYRVSGQIGRGGVGVVYLARDETLERDVALKMLPAGSLATEKARKRFRKEAQALARLNHPNIETVYEFGSEDGVDFLATEYVPGTTLAERVEAGPLAEAEILNLALQITSALEEAENRGLAHLDLKPRNMMVTPKGQIKLLDFGLAKLVRPDEADTTQSITEGPAVAGTPPYMAPEQLLGKRLDVRTDIYAVGASLYEAATGQLPFGARASAELIAAILQIPATTPRAVNPEISPGLERVILRCLEKDAHRRYQTARELRADLEQLATAGEPQAAPVRRRLTPVILGTIFALLAVVILAVWFSGSRPALSFFARTGSWLRSSTTRPIIRYLISR